METKTLRTDNGLDVVASVPYQLGFRPKDSIVIIGVKPPKGRLGMMSRFDLSPIQQAGAGREIAKQLIQYVKADGGNGAFVIRYGKPEDPPAKQDAAMRAVVQEFSKRLTKVACWDVTNNRVVPLHNSSLEEMGPGFTDADLASTKMAATMTSLGMTFQPDRAALADLPEVDRDSARRAQRCQRRELDKIQLMRADALLDWRLDQLKRWRSWLERLVEAGESCDQVDLPAIELGHMGALICEQTGRDAVMAAIINEVEGADVLAAEGYFNEQVFDNLAAPNKKIDQRYCDAAPRLLELVAAHQSQSFKACTLSVMAWFAWWHSDGARAEVLAEAALALPDPPKMAAMIKDFVQIGALPQAIRLAASQKKRQHH